MKLEPLELAGLVLLHPRIHADDRGWFIETWSAPCMALAGLGLGVAQDNHSFSTRAGTLRGLHYQAPPHTQAKLVRCTRGAVRDVAVDVRRGSATYGCWTMVELTADNHCQLWIPGGFLHGFVTLTDGAEVQYKCSDIYVPDCDGAVRWDSLGIDWGLTGAPVLSARDAAAPAFDDWISPFTDEALV